MCLKESVHLRNELGLMAFSSVAPVIVLLTPVDRGLDTGRQ